MTRHFPTVGFILIASAIYLGLVIRCAFGAAKVGLAGLAARLVPRDQGAGAGRGGRESRFQRLLVSELRRIERLQERIGALGAFQEPHLLQQEIAKSLKWLAGLLSATGRLALAELFYESSARYTPRFSEAWIDCMRTVGILRFMQGKMQDAIPCFAQVAQTKAFLRSRPRTPKNVRILAHSWFVALGHVAMIDFLVKKQKLGWEPPDVVFFNTDDVSSAPGQTLLLELGRLGIVLSRRESMGTVFDAVTQRHSIKRGDGREFTLPARSEDRTWGELDGLERAALLQEFWEMNFPDGQSLPYSHAAAKIQNRWEAEGRAPNFARRDETDATLGFLRRQVGIPDGAWYVCLHVRQSGFHSRWNRIWEQARDADISTYAAAMQAIVDAGGFVVRMGDPTMPRLAPMDGVIDYAHSNLKSEYADILLLSGARFFLGTNSGLSVVPATYGVPCVLTNWVPIGLPNWFGQDLVIPKLIRRRESQTLVSLEELYSTNLGYLQNPRDLPPEFEFVDNAPEDLVAVVEQMICELEGHPGEVRDKALEEAVFDLAVKHGSYRGSRMGTTFMRQYGQDLGVRLIKPISHPSRMAGELSLV